MRVAVPIGLSAAERTELERWARGRSTPARLVERSKIVLLAAAGKRNQEIAAELGLEELTVGRWRKRFAIRRLAGIEKDAPRGGRRPKLRESVVRKIVDVTTQRKPKNATHWSTRTLAAELGIDHVMVHRVWRANGLKPHLIKTLKLSNDQRFIEKMTDVVGLYLNPPEHAMVLCCDERSQIQALDRTQKSLPLKKGRCGTLTHDYVRNGTTTLFAALSMPTAGSSAIASRVTGIRNG
jgi:transposase